MQQQFVNNFKDLDNFMLTEKLMTNALKYKNNGNLNISKKSIETKENKEHKEINENNNFFTPPQKDGLFWCFYIIKNGFSAYEYPGVTSFINEKDLKIKLIEMIRTKKQILKLKKIKNIKEDVEDDLVNKEIISMKTFIALCAAENFNILFIHKKKCFELISEEENPYFIIHQSDNNVKYCYELNATKEIVDNYKNTLFKWESLERPLKAISYYKLDELMVLCKKLGLEEKINNLNKKAKKDLYEILIQNL
jgi:hypothetical protein